MAVCTNMITLDNLFLSLVAKILSGILVYSILVLVFDGEVRKLTWQAVRKKSFRGIV